MNLFLTQSPQIGAAKAYLLRQALSVAAKKSKIGRAHRLNSSHPLSSRMPSSA